MIVSFRYVFLELQVQTLIRHTLISYFSRGWDLVWLDIGRWMVLCVNIWAIRCPYARLCLRLMMALALYGIGMNAMTDFLGF